MKKITYKNDFCKLWVEKVECKVENQDFTQVFYWVVSETSDGKFLCTNDLYLSPCHNLYSAQYGLDKFVEEQAQNMEIIKEEEVEDECDSHFFHESGETNDS
jgi:hypothetical protein